MSTKSSSKESKNEGKTEGRKKNRAVQKTPPKKTMRENNPPAIDLSIDIKYPVIGFFGNEDQNPSPEDVNDYSRALTDAGVEHEFHRYDYTGHAFQSFNIEEKYSEDASEDAWTKVLDFFREKI